METAPQSVIQLRIQLKWFNTIDEIINDPLFKERVEFYINKEWIAYNDRPVLPPGRRYIRTGLNVMMDDNEFNTQFMMKHWADVYDKCSNLPSRKRDVIGFICNAATLDVLNSGIIFVKQGDKLYVKDVRAKLTVIEINNDKGTVKVELKKVREEWPIKQFVNSVVDKTLYYGS